jgi:hypothetical protein
MTEMYLAPIDGREADIFGSGINCISGRAVTAPAALSGVTAGGYEDRSFDERHLLVVQDSQSYASLLQTAATLSASGLTWSASASMSFLRDQTGSETSISFVGLRVHRSQLRVANMSNATVSEAVIADLQTLGPLGFADKYGTHYVKGVLYGGSFAGRLKILTSSSTEKTNVAAAVHGSISGFGVSGSVDASFSSQVSNASNSASTTVDLTTVGDGDSSHASTLDQMIAAWNNFSLVPNASAGTTGDAIAFVCGTWDEIPAIQTALNTMNQPNALQYETLQPNLNALAAEYGELSYIQNSCTDLLAHGNLALPAYTTLLTQIANVCGNHRARITALTMSQLASADLNALTVSPRLAGLVANISTGLAYVEFRWSLDGAFYGDTNHFSQQLVPANGVLTELGAVNHSRPEGGDEPQQMRFYYQVGQDGNGDSAIYALMHWRDPYGPPNELDQPGNIALLTGSNPATWVSSTSWTSYPWNQFSARLIGIDPAM